MMPDREKVIKGIETCRKTDCANCEYSTEVCLIDEIISDALALLKEQEEVVRCKDCKKRYTVLCIQEEVGNINNQDNWYCADGERK